MSSHISREMRSRMVRAFSRALAMHCTIELGLSCAEREKFEDVLGVGFTVELAKSVLLAGHDDQRLPAQTVGLLRLLEQHVVIHVENARGVLGALDVARQPEQRFRDAREHLSSSPRRTQVSLLPPPCEEFTTSEPRCSATRVRPPGTIVTFSPSYRQ